MQSLKRILEHFGLQEDPFGVTPDPEYLCFIDQYRNAVTRLHDSIANYRCLGVVCGQPGMGKTTLMQYLDEAMGQEADFGMLSCTMETKEELLFAVMAALGVSPEPGGYFPNWLQLHSHLLDRHGQRRRVVLIYDEAHRLSVQMLEMVRLLSNLETTRFKLLQIILCGQQTLLQKLNSRELEQMGQRVTVSVELQPLSVPETMTYIEHRLAVAGRTRRVFTAEAVTSITRLSRGVPRNINRLCYGSMGLACGKGRQTVDSELVEESFSEFRSILWVDPQEPGGGGLQPLSLPTPLRRRAYRDGRSAAPPSEEESPAAAHEPRPAAEESLAKAAAPGEPAYAFAAEAPEPSVEPGGGYGHRTSGGN